MPIKYISQEEQHKKNVSSIMSRLERLPKNYSFDVMNAIGVEREYRGMPGLRSDLLASDPQRVYMIERTLAGIEKQRRTKGITYR